MAQDKTKLEMAIVIARAWFNCDTVKEDNWKVKTLINTNTKSGLEYLYAKAVTLIEACGKTV